MGQHSNQLSHLTRAEQKSFTWVGPRDGEIGKNKGQGQKSMRNCKRQSILDKGCPLLCLTLTMTLTYPPGCLIPIVQVTAALFTLLELACLILHHWGWIHLEIV